MSTYFVVPDGYVRSIEFSFDVFEFISFFCLCGINEFYVYGSVHRESMSIIVQQDAAVYSLLCFRKLLVLFTGF